MSQPLRYVTLVVLALGIGIIVYARRTVPAVDAPSEVELVERREEAIVDTGPSPTPRTGFYYVYDREGAMIEGCAALDESHAAQLKDCVSERGPLSCRYGDNFVSVFERIEDCADAIKNSDPQK